MVSLIRTRSGQFYINDSIKLENFKKFVYDGKIQDVLIPVDKVLSDYSKVSVLESGNKYLYNGNKLSVNFTDKKDFIEDEKVIVYDYKGRVIGIYQFSESFIKPLTMLI